jgi:hypothetical protein
VGDGSDDGGSDDGATSGKAAVPFYLKIDFFFIAIS